MSCPHLPYRDLVAADFEDAWDALTDPERWALLDERDNPQVTPAIAGILIRVALAVEPQPGLFPAPVHWPHGFRDFLTDRLALIDPADLEDPECE